MKKITLIAFKEFLLAVLAGISISIGCIAFLSSGNKVIGSLFFVVGLFMVCNLNLNLFTGKICFALENKPSYLLKLVDIWLGNFAGAGITALLMRASRLSNLLENAQSLVSVKLADNLGSLFLLAIMCNILIFLAVYGYKKFEHPLAKTLALVFGVSVFVLCGFEHCVADMFYFMFAGTFTWNMILRVFIITLGNIVGGLLIPSIMKLTKYLDLKTGQNG